MITSHSNPLVRATMRLRKSSVRRETRKFLIDGQQEILAALDAGFDLETIFVSPALSDFHSHLASRKTAASKLVLVSDELLSKLSYGQQGCSSVAVGRTPDFPTANLRLTADSCVLVLDQTEKPGNLGACLRSAAASGISAVLLADPICEPLNPNAIRASRGAIFRTPIAVGSQPEIVHLLNRLSLPILCARTDGSQNLWDLELSTGAALVFGNEAKGLGTAWAQQSSFVIGMTERTDSLNLSISVAVVLYEAARQRSLGE